MKKGILCVFFGILFSTFYIEVNSFPLLPSILCYAMIASGTKICHSLAKSEQISNPAMEIACVLLVGAAVQTLVSQSETMRAFDWMVNIAMIIIYVYYLYAFLELLQAYAKKKEESIPLHAHVWQMGIVISSTIMVVLYCLHVFIPSSLLLYAYLGLGIIAKLCTFYLLIQWYRNSSAKGLR